MTHIHGEFLNKSKQRDKATRTHAQARYCVEEGAKKNSNETIQNETKCEARETK